LKRTSQQVYYKKLEGEIYIVFNNKIIKASNNELVAHAMFRTPWCKIPGIISVSNAMLKRGKKRPVEYFTRENNDIFNYFLLEIETKSLTDVKKMISSIILKKDKAKLKFKVLWQSVESK